MVKNGNIFIICGATQQCTLNTDTLYSNALVDMTVMIVARILVLLFFRYLDSPNVAEIEAISLILKTPFLFVQ